MSRAAAAALAAVLLAPCARAASASRASGTVVDAQVDANPVDGGGSLDIADRAGAVTQYSVRHATRLTRDGKPVGFDATLTGDVVVRAKFDPKTKTLTVLDLKSSSKPAASAAPAGPVGGEVAAADALKGALSVRLGPGRTREFKVVDATKVLREAEGKAPVEAGFETVAVGDAVVVLSRDGKTADEIRVRAAAR